MNNINEVCKNTLFTTNEIAAPGKEIKLSISSLSIKVKNTINEFIHQDRYVSKVEFDSATIFSKPKKIVISNEYNITNEEKIELKGKTKTWRSKIKKIFNFIGKEKIIFKKNQSILDFIELPNGKLIPIDKAINSLHSCEHNSLLKSKMLLIDYIADMQFKSLMNNNVELPEKSNSNYLKESEIEFDDTRYESVNFHLYESSEPYEKEPSMLSNLNNDDTQVGTNNTQVKSNDKKVEFHFNKNKLTIEKDEFKSFLIEITKDVSLLDRLSNGKGSYGYTFLSKVYSFLEDYNKIKNTSGNKKKKTYFNKKAYFNKKVYLKKLAESNHFLKLNEKVNNLIYLQYLKNEQSKHENGVIDEVIIKQPSDEEKLKEIEEQKRILDRADKTNEIKLSSIEEKNTEEKNTEEKNIEKKSIEEKHKDELNLIKNDDSMSDFLDEIDNQLKISNENKNLTLKELLAKVKQN
ncbi:hypothetical protein [Proteus hauseri]|uniref:hypothetical protein n=1 Tax=Proteus hauseri TaxID=183417 RepID=UPI0010095578|nr:hypothetical protein [Proteus hauseri]QAV23790.1 hypothetical protein PH4a_10755 [Proteus hauseri]